jgi:hypothetical protein
VKLSTGATAPIELATRSDGRAVFMLSFDRLPADQALQASVTGPNGGAPVMENIAAGAARWEITLPRAIKASDRAWQSCSTCIPEAVTQVRPKF